MPRRWPSAVLLALAIVLPGCLTGGAGDERDPPSGAGEGGGAKGAPQTAPWWVEGEWWDVELDYKGEKAKRYRLVNMWNDSETAHFWLGVRERSLALDHAFFDTNPFLGRIHHNILAPHERGMHAIMYSFPLTEGARWQGPLLAGDWEFEGHADPARAGVYVVEGRGSGGERIRYDYDPGIRWFRELEIKDGRGDVTLRAVVTGHGTGEKGTFWFHRGRDYYEGPQIRSGTHQETIRVTDEGLDFLALDLKLRASSPLTLEVVAPGGAVKARETLTAPSGGELRKVVEVADPVQGEWSLRFVTAGTIEGTITGTGIFETRRSI